MNARPAAARLKRAGPGTRAAVKRRRERADRTELSVPVLSGLHLSRGQGAPASPYIPSSSSR
jgi:hypothetical protein